MLRYLTAGESHGKALIAIIEGMPSNLPIDTKKINRMLELRQSGFGRGERMKIEKDAIEILSGIRGCKTLGSPICIKIENKDWVNWKDIMNSEETVSSESVCVPRPGHADLNGAVKYNTTDIRNILERASARETAVRTAVGCIAEQFLSMFDIQIFSHVIQIGTEKISSEYDFDENFREIVRKSKLRCVDKAAEKKMIYLIEQARLNEDTLGGIFEIAILGVPIGLGSCMHYDRKLDVKLAFEVMSIQGIKGIEFGKGFEYASDFGSKVQDEIFWDGVKYYRNTNYAGGIEGGMSSGEPIVLRAVMKPIPTQYKPLNSVDIKTKIHTKSVVHRSDTCAVPAASIVGHSAAAWAVACAFVEKFCGDSIEEVKRNYEGYIKQIKKQP